MGDMLKCNQCAYTNDLINYLKQTYCVPVQYAGDLCIVDFTRKDIKMSVMKANFLSLSVLSVARSIYWKKCHDMTHKI